MNSLKTFKVEQKILGRLTKDEQKILPLLIEAVKKIDKVYLLQEDKIYNGANIYAKNVTKAEIETAAKEDVKILSPFTVVEKDETGKIVAIDYHIKYQKELAPVVKLLNQAAALSANKSFAKFLKSAALALENGDYEGMDLAWLLVRNSNITMTIGPYERYLDKFFFIKRAYQASVGIYCIPRTQKARQIRDILYTTISQRPQRVIPPSIVDIQVEHTLIISGFLGRTLFAQQHLPSDSEMTERHGSRIITFLSSIDYKFENLIYPIFNSMFEKNFKNRYSKEILKQGNYYFILLQAIAQQLHRYRESRVRLKELFPVFDEANSTVTGIQNAKHLVLKGVIDQRELEAIMVADICWTFSEWILSKQSSVRQDYLRGDALTFNFLLKVGALQEQDGLSWPNFAKMFFEMENLASIFTRILESGTFADAQEFLSKYLSLEPFKAFDKSLVKIKPL